MKKALVILAALAFAAAAQAEVILNWNFVNSLIVSQVADTINANLDGGLNTVTRGGGAGTSAGASSFRTVGFQNNGISTANTDYFQISLSAAAGYELSLNTISGNFAGTAGFSTGAGVSHQWAYSFDDVSYSLIDSPVARVGNGTSSFDLSGTAALQNISDATTVYLRYYASGQTTTGGWGFYSGGGVSGVNVDGDLAPTGIPEPATMSLLGLGALAMVLRRKMSK